jgi:hypothetical protein
MPVTNGSTGIVTKVLKKNLEPILRKHSGDSLQKAAILVTSHNTESTAVRYLKLELWCLQLVQEEKYQREKACDERRDDDDDDDNDNNNNNKISAIISVTM